MIPLVIRIARFVAWLGERRPVSAVDVEPAYGAGAAQRTWLWRLGGWVLRVVMLVAGIGGIHTVLGWCPERGVRMQPWDQLQIVTGPARIALVLQEFYLAEAIWLTPRLRPMRVALCRRCGMPLEFEWLTTQRLAAAHAVHERARGAPPPEDPDVPRASARPN